MSLDKKDYKKWKKKYEAKGKKSCLEKYCIHKVFKDSNSNPKHVKDEDGKLKEKIRENQHLLNELWK